MAYCGPLGELLLRDLQTACAFWQKHLRIQDWTVTLQVVSYDDIPDAYGCFRVHADKKAVNIRLLRPDHAPTSDLFPEPSYDPFRTLVHELLHVRFYGMRTDLEDEHSRIAEEQAIDALTAFLYSHNIHRGISKNDCAYPLSILRRNSNCFSAQPRARRQRLGDRSVR